MDDASIEPRVRSVIYRSLRLPANGFQGNLQMGNPPAWDSLGHMELIAAIEKEFGVRFPGHALPQLVSLPAIVQAIESYSSR